MDCIDSRASRYMARNRASAAFGNRVDQDEPQGLARHEGCSFSYPFILMLTFGSFAVAFFAVLGCVWWACLDDNQI
jgi:hypothetical protein